MWYNKSLYFFSSGNLYSEIILNLKITLFRFFVKLSVSWSDRKSASISSDTAKEKLTRHLNYRKSALYFFHINIYIFLLYSHNVWIMDFRRRKCVIFSMPIISCMADEEFRVVVNFRGRSARIWAWHGYEIGSQWWKAAEKGGCSPTTPPRHLFDSAPCYYLNILLIDQRHPSKRSRASLFRSEPLFSHSSGIFLRFFHILLLLSCMRLYKYTFIRWRTTFA